jgi:hypothetical protein
MQRYGLHTACCVISPYSKLRGAVRSVHGSAYSVVDQEVGGRAGVEKADGPTWLVSLNKIAGGTETRELPSNHISPQIEPSSFHLTRSFNMHFGAIGSFQFAAEVRSV